MGKTSSAVHNRYARKVYDDLRIVVPRGRKADAMKYAAANGTTLNALVGDLLRQALDMTPEEWKMRSDSADTDDNQTTDDPTD